MLIWNLNTTMKRHHIRGNALALRLGVDENTVSRWRQSQTMPKISGDRLDALLTALNELADEDTLNCELLTSSTLFEWQPPDHVKVRFESLQYLCSTPSAYPLSS